jgi:hypothetical protein
VETSGVLLSLRLQDGELSGEVATGGEVHAEDAIGGGGVAVLDRIGCRIGTFAEVDPWIVLSMRTKCGSSFWSLPIHDPPMAFEKV